MTLLERRTLPLLLAGILLATVPGWAGAQVAVSAQAWLLAHRSSRAPERSGGASDLALTRPTVMIHAGHSWLTARATVSLEGLTMPDGELWLGGWGEGFVDRRHPHTYAHEVVVAAGRTLGCGALGRCRLGAFAGKGFVPFGSDDPMDRGFARFPANHHLAQILERAVAGAQAGTARWLLEGALFNGDEPERPGQWPRIGGRFGDSWAVRLTRDWGGGFESSASVASVASPEHRPGAGATQRKVHVGTGYRGGALGGRLRALAEFAETAELDRTFVFTTWLAEAEYRRGRWAVRYRAERTERPEEERLSPFRSARPHLENSILGTTRWTSHTAGAGLTLGSGRGGAEVMAEVTAGRIGRVGGGVFDPAVSYGGRRFLAGSVGLRLFWRPVEHRMGRYGAAEEGRAHH